MPRGPNQGVVTHPLELSNHSALDGGTGNSHTNIMEDKYIQCAEAGCDAVRKFTAGEQEFFKEKGYKDPKYCKAHSNARKAAKENQNNSPFKPALDEIRRRDKNDQFHGEGSNRDR